MWLGVPCVLVNPHWNLVTKPGAGTAVRARRFENSACGFCRSVFDLPPLVLLVTCDPQLSLHQRSWKNARKRTHRARDGKPLSYQEHHVLFCLLEDVCSTRIRSRIDIVALQLVRTSKAATDAEHSRSWKQFSLYMIYTEDAVRPSREKCTALSLIERVKHRERAKETTHLSLKNRH